MEHPIFPIIHQLCKTKKEEYGEGGKKIYAHCYIDDKNIGGFPGWLACVEEIERMEEAYKISLKEK